MYHILNDIWFIRLGGMLLKLVNADDRKKLRMYSEDMEAVN